MVWVDLRTPISGLNGILVSWKIRAVMIRWVQLLYVVDSSVVDLAVVVEQRRREIQR